jgi:chemotaxis protein CheD
MTPNKTVGIAEMLISTDPSDVLVTYSLGSCLGVTVHDPDARVGGIIHCMLPLSSVDGEKAKERPFMFVDTGVSIFLQKLFEAGVRRSSAVVKIAGCASVLDHQNLFRIGERNLTVFRKLMWKNNIIIAAQDVGGAKSRTVYLDMPTGRTLIRSDRETVEL